MKVMSVVCTGLIHQKHLESLMLQEPLLHTPLVQHINNTVVPNKISELTRDLENKEIKAGVRKRCKNKWKKLNQQLYKYITTQIGNKIFQAMYKVWSSYF